MTKEKTETDASHPESANAQRELPFDERLRRRAAELLAGHLALGGEFIGFCKQLSQDAKVDKTASIYAAARLMRASAHLADAFATVAQIERRRRTIVERIERGNLKQQELIAKKEDELHAAKTVERVYRRMNEHIEQSIKARLGEEGGYDSVARLVEHEGETVARLEREVDEAKAG
jgi:hypothetical protein